MSRVSARALLARKVRGGVSVLGRACPDAGTPALGLRCLPPGMQRFRRSLPCARHLIPSYVHELLRCSIACARHHLPRYVMGFKTLAIVRTMLFTKIFAWVFNDVILMRIIVWCNLVGSGKGALMPPQLKGGRGHRATAARIVAVAQYGRASRWNSYGYGRMCCREGIRGDALRRAAWH